MSRASKGPVSPADLPYSLFRRAAVPALGAAALCVVAAAAWWGWSGAVGSLVGAVVVGAFYLADLGTLRFVERLEGHALMPVMLAEYVIKVVILAVMFAALWDTTAFNVQAMALTVVFATIVWTVALGTFAARAKTFVVDVSAHQSHDDL